MVLLRRSRSQERSDKNCDAKGDQEIVEGCHVVVLQGRHFPAFGAGDEGVVLRVDEEAQNCHVHFRGKAHAVQVALRHIRFISHARDESHDPIAAAGVCGCQLATPREANVVEPSDHMEMAAGFAAGFAAVSSGGAIGATLTDPVAIFQQRPFDVHEGAGSADGTWHGGTPQINLPSSVTADSPPTTPLVLSHFHSSPIPSLSAVGIAPLPANATACYCTPYKSVVRDASFQNWASHPEMQPLACKPEPLAKMPVAATALAWDHPTQLESFEVQLASIQERHRAEIEGLRHALEECIHAIGTCAQAIDAICANAVDSEREQRTKATQAGVCQWEQAAAALHNAADLGMTALISTSSGHVGRQMPCSDQQTREGASASPMPSVWSSPILPICRSSDKPQPPVCRICASQRPQTIGGATSPSAGGDASRRYLVASPTTLPALHHCAAGATLLSQSSATQPQIFPSCLSDGVGGSGALGNVHNPGSSVALWSSSAAPVAAAAPPASAQQTTLYASQSAGTASHVFVPPMNLLGSIPGLPGLPSLPGLPGLLGLAPALAPPSGRSGVMRRDGPSRAHWGPAG